MESKLKLAWWALLVVTCTSAIAAPGHLVHAQHVTPTLASAQASRTSNADMLLGEWWTEGREGRIKFVRKADGTFVGTTTCCKPRPDVNNPNPELRQRSTVGIVLIWQLRYLGDGQFENGYVYNPRDGDTYRMDIKVIDNDTIKIRGYLGISLLGQSQIWLRAKPSPSPATSAASGTH